MTELVVRVYCPYCGFKFATRSLQRAKCHQCGKKFSLYPKGKRSRITGIQKGTIEDLLRARQKISKQPRLGDIDEKKEVLDYYGVIEEK